MKKYKPNFVFFEKRKKTRTKKYGGKFYFKKQTK